MTAESFGVTALTLFGRLIRAWPHKKGGGRDCDLRTDMDLTRTCNLTPVHPLTCSIQITHLEQETNALWVTWKALLENSFCERNGMAKTAHLGKMSTIITTLMQLSSNTFQEAEFTND